MEEKLNRLEEEIRLLKLKLEYAEKEIAKYRDLAYTDTLTQLKNRRSLEEIDNFDSVIMCDIDHFKHINDTYGHAMGDEILKSVSNILKENIRKGDLACRWGGEEFLILLKNCDLDNAYKKAETIRLKIQELSGIYNFDISMSFGVSDFLESSSLDEVQKEADNALYQSKENGRNKTTVFNRNKKKLI